MTDVRLRVRFFTPGVHACFEQLRRERVERVVVEFPRCDQADYDVFEYLRRDRADFDAVEYLRRDRAETGVAAAVQHVVLALLECAVQRDLDVLRSAV